MARLSVVKPSTAVEKTTRTTVDTVLLTPEVVKRWLAPPFQRPIKVNARVQAVAEEIKRNGGVLPGILTLGVLEGKTYLIDGQHRKEAWLLAGLAEGFADVRTCFFDDTAHMSDEFFKLNSALVAFKPDDKLRALECSSEPLTELRRRCSFVGYDNVRRGPYNPVVSMSLVLRAWQGAGHEAPGASQSGASVADLVGALSADSADQLAVFLTLCFEAWGRDQEYARLWSRLNLTICGWLFRRSVLTPPSANQRYDRLSKEAFRQGLQALSANGVYLDWLVGRLMSDRDRAPCYDKVRDTFVKRLQVETGERLKFPQPAWAARGKSRV